MKYICDGCGKEIVVNPIVIYAEKVDRETGDFNADDASGFCYVPNKDFCDDCMKRIIHFIDELPKGNNKKVVVANTKFDEPEKPLMQKAKKKVDKDPMQPKIQKLLGEGKTVEEITELTGCKKQAVYVARNILKKKSVRQAAQTDLKKYKCSEVQKNCAYAGKAGSLVICDFIGKTGHKRGCPAEECTAYQKVGK
jgi:hypothetical protein